MALLIDDRIDFALDDDGDLIIPLQWSSGLAGVAQGIRIRLLTFRGEWFLDFQHGVPWMANDTVAESDAILGGKFNQTRATAEIRKVLLESPGVLAVTHLSVTFEATRRLVIDWAVSTEFGDTEPETTEV